MENLSLRDRRHTSHHDGYHYYSPRLPTPEESSCGSRSYDDESSGEKARGGSMSAEAAIVPPTRLFERDAMDSSGRRPFSRGVGHSRSRPVSPPYQPSDMQKPSLPPLKTILASSISSPPGSPTYLCSSSLQPSPQEPTYTAATYKPPSLYPHKKQRIDYQPEPVAPFTAHETNTSPSFHPVAFEPGAHRAPGRSPALHGEPSPRTRFGESNRSTVQPQQQPQSRPHFQTSASPKAVNGHAYPLSAREPQARSAIPKPDARDYGPFQPSFPGPNGPPGYRPPPPRQSVGCPASSQNGFDPRYEHMPSRRDSIQGSHELAPGYYDSRHDHRPVHHIEAQRQYTHPRPDGHYESASYPRRIELVSHDRDPDIGYNMYGGKQPSFFMPSQYDYRHGRARKRSNLPKQSTEIMKTWFDHNISNPYPSEEQKAVFSNATGISMTQVSNWFINHRRRCPELRDKRTRGRECDL